jgi:hypothetical protein
VVFVTLLLVDCGSQPARIQASNAPGSFARGLRPIFAQSYMPCHVGSPDSKSPYVLTKYEGVIGNGKDSVADVVAANADSAFLCQVLATGLHFLDTSRRCSIISCLVLNKASQQ